MVRDKDDMSVEDQSRTYAKFGLCVAKSTETHFLWDQAKQPIYIAVCSLAVRSCVIVSWRLCRVRS